MGSLRGNLMSRRDIVVASPRRATGDSKRTMDATRHLSLSRSLSVSVWPPAHLMLSSLTKLKRDFRLCFLCLLFSSFFSTMFNQLSRYLLSVLLPCCPSFRIYRWPSFSDERETERQGESVIRGVQDYCVRNTITYK